MMEPLTLESSVGDWVSERWSRATVLQRLGIDFCCGGKLSLASACTRLALNPDEVLASLQAQQGHAPEDEVRWESAPLKDLIAHILAAHHEHLRSHLPTLKALTVKVARVHGEAHPELLALRDLFVRFAADMLAHMDKEEGVLFPLCLALAAGEQPTWGPPLSAPVACMEAEHEEAGRDLLAMRRLSNGYQVPEQACGSWRALWHGLADLEANTFRHVHLENHVLFPRALALGSGGSRALA